MYPSIPFPRFLSSALREAEKGLPPLSLRRVTTAGGANPSLPFKFESRQTQDAKKEDIPIAERIS